MYRGSFAILVVVDTASAARQRLIRSARRVDSDTDEATGAGAPARPDMAVSIAGQSRACSKDALVSQAKAVKKALSSE
jgi:hypothetical protein